MIEVRSTPQRSVRSKRIRKASVNAVWYLVLILVAIVMMFPFGWMVSTSLKTLTEASSFPPTWLPSHFQFGNYWQALTKYGIGRSFVNSAIVTVCVVAGQLIVCSTGGYAFARLPFRGREALFLVYLATLMISFQVTLVPLYLLMRSLHLLNSYYGLIIPGLFSPLGTFLMRQFIRQIPRDLDEAVLVDGGNHWSIFWHVILPLCRPVLGALAVLSFLETWNALLWPLVAVNTSALYTLPLALATFAGQYVTLLNLQMAGAVMTTVPVIVVFLILQRQFVAGIGFNAGLNR